MTPQVPNFIDAPPTAADVNIEFGHFYCYPPESPLMQAHLEEARQTALEAERLRGLLVRAGQRVSTSLFVDDLSQAYPYSDSELLDLLATWPIHPDYVVRESSMRPIVLERMPGKSPNCTHLTLAWYLARLGTPDFAPHISYRNGSPYTLSAQRILTVLPVSYMALEARVHSLLQNRYSVGPRAAWLFV
jgi:hypothetical protein